MTFAEHKLVIFLVHKEFEASQTVPHSNLAIPAFDRAIRLEHPDAPLTQGYL